MLDDGKRRAIAGYLEVLKGGSGGGRRVNVRRPLHPHIRYVNVSAGVSYFHIHFFSLSPFSNIILFKNNQPKPKHPKTTLSIRHPPRPGSLG